MNENRQNQQGMQLAQEQMQQAQAQMQQAQVQMQQTQMQQVQAQMQQAQEEMQKAQEQMQQAQMQMQQAPVNQQVDLKQVRKHFSKVGLMAFLGSLIIMVIQTVAVVIAELINPSLVQNMNSYFTIAMLPVYLIGMPLAILLLTRVPGQKIEKRKMKFGHWILAFFMCYALMYVSNLFGQFLTMIIGILKGGMVQDAIANVATSISPGLCFIFMVLFAPVLEEIIFRKVIVERTVKYGEGIAIVLSAFMFGMYHGNLNQFVYAFALGLFFAFIYVKTGKLIYTIALHMVINFMGSVLGVWILDFIDTEAISQLSMLTDTGEMMSALMKVLPGLIALLAYFVFIVAVVITGIVLLIVMRKKFTCRPGTVRIPSGKRFQTVILNVGMILFIIIWLIMIIMQLFQ